MVKDFVNWLQKEKKQFLFLTNSSERTIKKRLNRKLAIEGILLTMVDFRTNYARDIASRVHTTYGSQIEVFENVIPMSVKAAETSAEGKSIYMHCPKGKVAEAYKNLTQEVLKNEK